MSLSSLTEFFLGLSRYLPYVEFWNDIWLGEVSLNRDTNSSGLFEHSLCDWLISFNLSGVFNSSVGAMVAANFAHSLWTNLLTLRRPVKLLLISTLLFSASYLLRMKSISYSLKSGLLKKFITF